MPNRDDVSGEFVQGEGRETPGLGVATADQGRRDERAAKVVAVGGAQQGTGRARRTAGEALKDIGDRIKK